MNSPHFYYTSMDFLFFLLLLSSPLPSIANDYFINCGSSSPSPSPTNDARTFSPDAPLPGVHLSSPSSTVSHNPLTLPLLYRTSIVFSSPSSYNFKLLTTGTYLLRLHFFSPSTSLFNFNISASNLTLLHDFVPNPNSLTIHEFFLLLNSPQFSLFFIPISPSLPAFVTAIELFHTPLTNFTSRSTVLHTIHRINFGGYTVPPSNDRLWRNWLIDDPYLLTKNAARNGPIRISRPNYRFRKANDYDAPDAVYNTAKELNRSSGHLDQFFNSTWRFGVSKRCFYFVRVHFCDMISAALGATVFDLYVSRSFAVKVDPYMIVPYLAAPFYLDFVVESVDTGFLDVGIGPRNDTRITENAFINGLEIMEILSSSAVEPQIFDHGETHTGLVSVIAVVSCIVVLGTYLKAYRQIIQVKTAELFPNWQFVRVEGGVLNCETQLGEKTSSKLLGF